MCLIIGDLGGNSMKICPKCNTGNSDNALKCKECEAYIGKIEVTESSKIVDEFNMKEKEKGKNKANCKNYMYCVYNCKLCFIFYCSIFKRGFFHSFVFFNPLCNYRIFKYFPSGNFVQVKIFYCN